MQKKEVKKATATPVVNDLDKLLNMTADDGSILELGGTKRNVDGIYRPVDDFNQLKNGESVKRTIRFLPNYSKDKKFGQTYIVKHHHFIKVPGDSSLSGYYDCFRNFGSPTDCPLCQLYKKLANSKNQVDKEKAELIDKGRYFYSYILIKEDKQHPDLVGKILIYQYGVKVLDKIIAEKKGEITDPCNVFALNNGKDFKLIVKKLDNGQINYDTSQFLASSPVSIYKNKKFYETPLDSDGKLTDSKSINAVIGFLLDREYDIDDFAPKKWDDETSEKIEKIISIFNGEDIVNSMDSIKASKSGNISSGDDYDKVGEDDGLGNMGIDDDEEDENENTFFNDEEDDTRNENNENEKEEDPFA